MNIYVIKFPDGRYAQGSSWKTTTDISKAKLYGSIGGARQAMSYHRFGEKGAWIEVFDAFPVGNEPHANYDKLMSFYQTKDVAALIRCMEYHIESLQQQVRSLKPAQAAVNIVRT